MEILELQLAKLARKVSFRMTLLILLVSYSSKSANYTSRSSSGSRKRRWIQKASSQQASTRELKTVR